MHTICIKSTTSHLQKSLITIHHPQKKALHLQQQRAIKNIILQTVTSRKAVINKKAVLSRKAALSKDQTLSIRAELKKVVKGRSAFLF